MIIAILDGPDSDSGTCFEVGYGFALAKPIIGARTDFRQCGDTGGLNLMLSESCNHIITVSSLENENSVHIIASELFESIKLMDKIK